MFFVRFIMLFISLCISFILIYPSSKAFANPVLDRNWIGSLNCNDQEISFSVLRINGYSYVYLRDKKKGNPNYFYGFYSASIEYEKDGKSFTIKPKKWLLRPRGYSLYKLEGKLLNDSILGTASPNCTDFTAEPLPAVDDINDPFVIGIISSDPIKKITYSKKFTDSSLIDMNGKDFLGFMILFSGSNLDNAELQYLLGKSFYFIRGNKSRAFHHLQRSYSLGLRGAGESINTLARISYRFCSQNKEACTVKPYKKPQTLVNDYSYKILDTTPSTKCDKLAAYNIDIDIPNDIKGVSNNEVRKNSEKSIKQCISDLSSYPKSRRLNFNLYRSYLNAGKDDEALKHLKIADKLGSAVAAGVLGITYERLSGIGKRRIVNGTYLRMAVENYEESIERGSNYFKANLANFYKGGVHVKRNMKKVRSLCIDYIRDPLSDAIDKGTCNEFIEKANSEIIRDRLSINIIPDNNKTFMQCSDIIVSKDIEYDIKYALDYMYSIEISWNNDEYYDIVQRHINKAISESTGMGNIASTTLPVLARKKTKSLLSEIFQSPEFITLMRESLENSIKKTETYSSDNLDKYLHLYKCMESIANIDSPKKVISRIVENNNKDYKLTITKDLNRKFDVNVVDIISVELANKITNRIADRVTSRVAARLNFIYGMIAVAEDSQFGVYNIIEKELHNPRTLRFIISETNSSISNYITEKIITSKNSNGNK